MLRPTTTFSVNKDILPMMFRLGCFDTGVYTAGELNICYNRC